MDPDKRRAIARKGGLAVAPEDRSFSKNRELAARAGAIGGAAIKAENRTYSKDKELAKISGRKGGLASHHGHSSRGR
jgi:general stress protein YciG